MSRKKSTPLSVTEQQIVDAREAAAILKAAGADCRACGQDNSIFRRRVLQITQEAAAWFRTSTDQNPLVALRYIAALSEAAALHEELHYRVRKGEQAHERLHATAGESADTESDD